MQKFNIGDVVRVNEHGFNASQFNNKKHKSYRGVYQFEEWRKLKFEICGLPRYWEGFGVTKGCDCYPVSLNGEEIGYVYESALEKI